MRNGGRRVELLSDGELDRRRGIDTLAGLWALAEDAADWDNGLDWLIGSRRGWSRDGRGCLLERRERQSGVRDGRRGNGDRLSYKVGHDEGGSGWDGWASKQHAYAGARDSSGSRRGILSDDGAFGCIGPGDVGGRPDFEGSAANLNGGNALIETDEVGYGDALRAEAFGEAKMPFAADHASRRGRLAHDVPDGDVHAVDMAIHAEIETEVRGFAGGVSGGEPFEGGNRDFGPMDGEVHGDDGRQHRQNGEHEQHEQKLKCAEHS